MGASYVKALRLYSLDLGELKEIESLGSF